jgi:GNAT superfamily N-acetyltransferase
MQRAAPTGLTLAPAGEGDFEALLALRMAAMRESLERAGHFDPQRVRERLSRGYLPAHTRHILKDGELVGFVVVQPRESDWLLDHLYIHPSAQGEGIGSWVLERVLAEADLRGKAVAVTALKHSAANRFYLRHDFILKAEGEWDLYYLRPARPLVPPSGAGRA